VAKEFNRSRSTVASIRDAEGVGRTDSQKTAAAAAALREFDAQRRREVIALLVSRIVAVAETTTGAQSLQQLAVAVGIMVDKMRLEENKATGISEERNRGRPVAELTDDELRARIEQLRAN
jgi:hypothetical protein